MALTVAMAVLASPIKRYTDDTATQLADTAAYAQAVLGLAPGQPSTSTRPYDGARQSTPAPQPQAPAEPAATDTPAKETR
jgi:multicomponent K+:H+ antiporter subunit D